MTRILITGASGLLGINLAQEIMPVHEVIGVDRGKLINAPFKVVKADLSDPRHLDSILDSERPAWLINCAALADLEACEKDPDTARRLNIDLPAQLAKSCKAREIRFVHISTDAVFDGEKFGAYSEDDAPNPLGAYAQTKLNGELSALSENPRAIVARVNFYGWSLNGRRSLAEFFVGSLENKKNVSGFTDVMFCPMLVNDTARTLIKMLEKNLAGLYHLVGAEAMSKYQFGVEIARKFQFDENLIAPKSVRASNLTARRSPNLWLSTHKLSTALGESLPTFSTGLNEFYTQRQSGYPQKIRSYQQG
ncbi:MAG: SDR family oxidoreductase [Anaerolineales bacterium]|nr:SDR family oxidoreductase [Anaerolineales bacterium]